MQRTQHSFIKNVKEHKECSVLFIKNAKEHENVAFFWKEHKRTKERCILLKRMHAQTCWYRYPLLVLLLSKIFVQEKFKLKLLFFEVRICNTIALSPLCPSYTHSALRSDNVWVPTSRSNNVCAPTFCAVFPSHCSQLCYFYIFWVTSLFSKHFEPGFFLTARAKITGSSSATLVSTDYSTLKTVQYRYCLVNPAAAVCSL